MVNSSQVEFLVDTANCVFGDDYPPYAHVNLPHPVVGPAIPPPNQFTVRALWTRDGLRPRWGNLAAVAHQLVEPTGARLRWWEEVTENLGISLIMLSSDEHFLLMSRTPSSQISTRRTTQECLREALEEERRRLFSPRGLSSVRTGQLSFADLEESVSKQSFGYYLRHKAQLDEALEDALTGAVKAQLDTTRFGMPGGRERRLVASIVNSVTMVAIAYLASRVLEDKGFFGEDSMPESDPKKLLEQTIGRTDGFFRLAYNDHLPSLGLDTLVQLAKYIGSSVSFALVDHRDVGRLYERALRVTQQITQESAGPTTSPSGGLEFPDLQQHYTPQAIAERMLDMLPLERLAPEERVFFDPAAGSGSLLLAATRRLALMPDVTLLPNRFRYLASHVAGNDLDPNAQCITKLRYSLVQQAFGRPELFPDPLHFGKEDYCGDNAWSLPQRPRVIIANPPFKEEKQMHRAAKFVHIIADRMMDGDQFAIVLPQTFLIGSKRGWPEARKALSEKCDIIETWQLPEGVIGLSARQPVCVVIGVVGKRRLTSTIARAVVSGARVDAVRDEGFLGEAWLAPCPAGSEIWTETVAPVPRISAGTVRLGDLFHVCSGVMTQKGVPPVSRPVSGILVKRYWRNGWKEPGRVWANPTRVPPDGRYIRYGKDYLYRHMPEYEQFYDSPKVLVNRSTNRNARDPLGASIDTEGLCPSYDTLCAIPKEPDEQPEPTSRMPNGWPELDRMERLYWLLGILTSEFATAFSMSMRGVRHLNKGSLELFPLPLKVDRAIVDMVRGMVEDEMTGAPDSRLSSLREALNRYVRESYGNLQTPSRFLTRTGPLAGIHQRAEEQRRTPALTVIGQVTKSDLHASLVKLYLDGVLDDEDEAWIPLPLELPGWALDGTVFEAKLPRDVRSSLDLMKRPWALREFKHTPRPYLSIDELQKRLLARMERDR